MLSPAIPLTAYGESSAGLKRAHTHIQSNAWFYSPFVHQVRDASCLHCARAARSPTSRGSPSGCDQNSDVCCIDNATPKPVVFLECIGKVSFSFLFLFLFYFLAWSAGSSLTVPITIQCITTGGLMETQRESNNTFDLRQIVTRLFSYV